MANDLTSTPSLWVLDTAGIILSERAVCIQKIIYFPDAANDTFTMKQWKENSNVAAGTLSNKTGTITSTTTLTSAGNLPASIADGYIFEIVGTSGTADNLGKKLVATAGDGDAVIIHDADWTNEASIIYGWQTYATVEALTLRAGASDESPIHLDFGPWGKWFPNLTLESLSASSVIRVYLR